MNHVHHWRIEPPAGPTSKAKCVKRDCKARRIFSNVDPANPMVKCRVCQAYKPWNAETFRASRQGLTTVCVMCPVKGVAVAV